MMNKICSCEYTRLSVGDDDHLFLMLLLSAMLSRGA